MHVPQSFVQQHARVPSVSLYYAYVAIVQYLVQLLASFLVLLHYFHGIEVRLPFHYMYRSASAAHHHYVSHVGVVVLANEVSYVLDVLLGSHEIGYVSKPQFVVSSWDDGALASLYGYYVVWGLRSAQVLQGYVQDVCRFPELDSQHYQGTALHFPVLSHPRPLEPVEYLVGCKGFGIYDGVDAHVAE